MYKFYFYCKYNKDKLQVFIFVINDFILLFLEPVGIIETG